jgi:hypothetical protein
MTPSAVVHRLPCTFSCVPLNVLVETEAEAEVPAEEAVTAGVTVLVGSDTPFKDAASSNGAFPFAS